MDKYLFSCTNFKKDVSDMCLNNVHITWATDGVAGCVHYDAFFQHTWRAATALILIHHAHTHKPIIFYLFFFFINMLYLILQSTVITKTFPNSILPLADLRGAPRGPEPPMAR